jgi:hypothetical protein
MNFDGDDTSLRLATELVKKGPVDANSWSRRTEAEIRSAIEHDDLLKNNDWNAVRCSRNGCIAAIDSLDPLAATRRFVFLARILTYVTPRKPSHHADWTSVTVDPVNPAIPGHERAYRHIVFFLFPGRSTAEETSGADGGKAN